MGQVKISTLFRQGSVLETLFVPWSRRRRTGEGLEKRLGYTFIMTERFVNPPCHPSPCAGFWGQK